MSEVREAPCEDARRRNHAASDFGGLMHAPPRAVVRATSTSDVVRALRDARAHGCAVAARGVGHTTRGQSLARGGIVIDTSALSAIVISQDGHTAAVGAGALWHDLVQLTLERGVMPPALTDYLGLSVGGTLSVGGIGGQSFHHGLQVDQVERLTVVTGEAEVVECSAERHDDLFQGCLAGLGQCGIIVAATVRLVPAPRHLLVYRLRCRDLAGFLGAQTRLADSDLPSYLLGSIVPVDGDWRYDIEVCEDAGRASDLPGLLAALAADGACPEATAVTAWAHASRLDAMAAAMKQDGTWTAFHPWMDLLVPESTAGDIIAFALSKLDPADLVGGHVMTYPLLRRRGRAKLVAWPDEAHCFLFDVLPSFRRDDVGRLERFETTLGCVWDRARVSGATVYPIGYPLGTAAMTTTDWRRQFGSQWSAFAASKRRYDPGAILTPGPGIFSAGRPA